SGKQFFHPRGQRMGHVIDPRTGWPSGDLLSLTLIGKTAAKSDALATGLLLDGKQRALELGQRNKVRAFIGVSAENKDAEVEVISAGQEERPEPLWQPFC